MKISDTPKVSIITCFLNVGELLQEAVKSVLQQEYQNWEMWLIDDGSSDCSSKIAQDYSTKHPGRIFYHEHDEHQNLGASVSRNVGIEHSTGELIAFLDGDDVWLPNLLVELINLMQQHSVAMVCEATEYWYSWNKSADQNTVIPVGAKQDCVHRPPQLMLDLYPLGNGAAPCICGILVRKDVVQKHGGFESYFKGMYDDQAFLIKFYLNEAVYISSGYHNLYRQRPGSLVASSHSNGKYYSERSRFLNWLEHYLYLNKINYPEVREVLAQAIYPFRYPFLYSVNRIINKGGKWFLKKLLQNFR